MSGRWRLGLLAGALIGGLGGLLEAFGSPVTTPWKWVHLPAADGLLGALGGVLAAFLAGNGRPGRIAGLAAFPWFATGLGLFVNRTLLSGTHFASPKSLIADAIALFVAGALAFGVARLVRRRSPHPPGWGATIAVLIALGLGTQASRWAFDAGDRDDTRPDVVVISIDTLRPDALSTGGEPEPTSPTLDRWLRESRTFVEALAPNPGSAASHAALFTSRYPVSNGVWSNFTVMDTSLVTLAEILRADGYRTGGFATNTFLGRRYHFDQGFDAYVESGQVERLEEGSPAALWRSLGLVQIVDRLRGRLDSGYDPSFETALAWLRESNRPTLWFVHIMDVHSPYVPEEPWGERFHADRGVDRGGERNRFGWRPSLEAYRAEVRFADSKMERLRRTIDACDRAGRTVTLLTSDHGENLLDHEPNFSHGRTLFDSTLRIVAAIHAPGLGVSPGLEPVPLENVDLLPTLFAVLGRSAWPEWEGRSFHPVTPPARPTIAQLNRDFAYRTRDAKLILHEDGAREFYRLDEDPGERRPATTPPPECVAQEELVRAWIAAHATELWTGAKSVTADELTPELREKLEGLGYLD
ncbi:MAG: sulfatase-like hydrolase/transferase [Gemmatimonadetes bacterium]|nr:sulfatase-like hydrolase/transferase [Gemmatimonadota bacterium]